MIYKSYLIEENIKILKNNCVLFYGENLGLIEDLKRKITLANSKNKILRYSQEDIIRNEEIFFNEIKNISLFEEVKIFFISDVNDKILKILEGVKNELHENKIFLFSGILEKKSKLRNFFEKETHTDIVPCYEDNELNIKKIILKNFKDFSGLTTDVINILIENCGKDRNKLNNEINKIKSYFTNKKIDLNTLNRLLNLKITDDFNQIKDEALNGNNFKTNKLLNSTVIDSDKTILYINLFNQRLNKLKQINELSVNNINEAINTIKPPIFWKDKSIFLHQAKVWNQKKINLALNTTYDVELKVKSNSDIDKRTIVKKLIVDICNLANV